MPALAAAAVVTVGSYMASRSKAKAARNAARTQAGAATEGVEEQRSQLDEIEKLLKPYVEAGPGALSAQQNLIGLGGTAAQRSAVNALQVSPEFQALNRQGQNAILQNASATGGLRGGNVQGALSQFSPNLLNSMINQQYQRLGGLTTLGQQSTVQQAQFGQQTAANIANLLQQRGAATAGGQLAQAQASPWNAINHGIGTYFGAGGNFGGLLGGGGGGGNAPVGGSGLTYPGMASAGSGNLYSLTSRSAF